MSNNRTVRNSSIEILRIIAMLFIVLSHSSVHGGFELGEIEWGINKFFLNCFTLGNLGVDIFVLISGYFLSKRDFDIKGIIKLQIQVLIYSIGAVFVGIFVGYEYSVMEVIKSVFPIIFQKYWFITAYIVLYIISPYINLMLNSSTRKQLLRLIISLLFMWVVIPTFTGKSMYGDFIPQFIMFYIIGAYFRQYADNIFSRRHIRILLTVVSFVLLFSSTFCFGLLENKVDIFKSHGTFFYHRNSILVVGCAVGLFSIALHCKNHCSTIINVISGCTLGVYLIHDNPIIRDLLWNKIFDNTAYVNDVLLPIRLLICSLIVYVVSTIIEYIRQLVLGKPINFFSTKLSERIKKMLAKFSVEGN